MSIKHLRVSEYVRITLRECEIDADWNNFLSIEAAIDFLEMYGLGNDHGFVVVKKDLWKYIP